MSVESPRRTWKLSPANLHELLTFLQRLWRYFFEPCSPQAYLLDLLLLRVLGPSFGWKPK